MGSNQILDWHFIPGTNKAYSVSNTGLIRSNARYTKHPRGGDMWRNEKILKPSIHRDGYLKYILKYETGRKTLQAHRIVASVFIKNPNKLPQINHIDGDKKNNNASNLEWCNPSQNIKHAFNTGLKKAAFGEDHPLSKLSKLDVKKIRDDKKRTHKQIANDFGVSRQNISKIKSNKRWAKL